MARRRPSAPVPGPERVEPPPPVDFGVPRYRLIPFAMYADTTPGRACRHCGWWTQPFTATLSASRTRTAANRDSFFGHFCRFCYDRTVAARISHLNATCGPQPGGGDRVAAITYCHGCCPNPTDEIMEWRDITDQWLYDFGNLHPQPVIAADHAPFVATLVERPNDRAARLVYADWLEERDQVWPALLHRLIACEADAFVRRSAIPAGLRLPRWVDRTRPLRLAYWPAEAALLVRGTLGGAARPQRSSPHWTGEPLFILTLIGGQATWCVGRHGLFHDVLRPTALARPPAAAGPFTAAVADIIAQYQTGRRPRTGKFPRR